MDVLGSGSGNKVGVITCDSIVTTNVFRALVSCFPFLSFGVHLFLRDRLRQIVSLSGRLFDRSGSRHF